MDPTSAFVENGHQSLEMQWAMGSVEPASKKIESSLSLFSKTGRKKLQRGVLQYDAQLNSYSSISAETLLIPSILWIQNRKI